MNKLIFACLFLLAAMTFSQEVTTTTISATLPADADLDIDWSWGNEEGETGEGETGEGEGEVGEGTEGEVIEGGGSSNEEEWIGGEEGVSYEEEWVDVGEILEEDSVEIIPVEIEPVA